MAKIILNVETQVKQSEAQLKSLAKTVKSIGTSLSSVKVDPNLTAQINSLTKYYNSLSKVVEKNTKVNYQNEIQAQKLAFEKAKTIKVTNDETRAQEKHEAQMKKSTEQTKKSTQANKEHKESLGTMITNVFKWQMAMTAVMKPIQLARQALEDLNETLIETEKRVIALRRVAGQAANAEELYALAQKYGQTFENVVAVTENFAKSGYDWADSIKAAEAALISMNVAELDAEQSSEGLIAIMKQFDMEVDELNYIIGLLNKTADTAAVSTDELLTALQKTGSTAKNAGLDLRETTALITALSEATGASGQNIGNALRSLFIFSSDKKALDTFASLSEAMEQTVKSYRAGQSSILDVWKELGGELGRLEGEKGLLSDLFDETDLDSDLAAELTQIEDQFAEIYGTAGNYRQNYFIALLNNLDEVEEALGEMQDVEQYSQKENLLHMDTYEAKVNSLKATWQSLANDEQGFLSVGKTMAEMGIVLLNFIDIFGGLETVLAGVSALLLYMFGSKMVSAIISMGNAMVTAFTKATASANAFNVAASKIAIVIAAFSAIMGAYKSVVEALEKREEKLRQANADIVKDSLEATEAYKKEAEAIASYASRIEELRAIKDNLASSDDEVQSAESELLSIQNELVESTNKYADSLDLVNGNLADQLGYTKEINEEMARQQAQKWLEENKRAIEIARGTVNDSGSLSIDSLLKSDDQWGEDWGSQWGMFEGWRLHDVASKLAQAGGEKVSFDENLNLPWHYFFGIGALIDSIKEFINSGDALGAVNAGWSSYIKPESYLGEVIYDFTVDGTRTEKIDALNNMLAALEDYESMEMTSDEASLARSLIKSELDALETDEYKNAEDLAELAQAHEDFFNGVISFEEWMKKANDYTVDTSEETAKMTNSLADLSDGVMSELVEKFREMRDASKESYEYEEKKKAVLDAEQALLNAQNDRTVRVFNRETGMFELRQNEKAIAEAEENLEEARYEMEEAAYDEIEKLLGAGNVTNAAILAIIAKWTPNGEDDTWADGIKNFFHDEYGIDLDKPTLNEMLNVGARSTDMESTVNPMGIMFGASSASTSANPALAYTRGGGISSHDTYYNWNGVQISREVAETYTVAQLLENTDLFKN